MEEKTIPNTKAPFLPAEILTQVFSLALLPYSFKIDITTLYNAALVNHYWNSAATPVLYRHVDIRWPGAEPAGRKSPQSDLLIKTLALNPNIAALVHSVSHSRSGPEDYYQNTQMTAWDNASYELVNTAASNLTSVKHLSIFEPNHKLASSLISHLLPHVHSFSLGMAQLEDILFPTNIQYPALRDLELRDLWSYPPTDGYIEDPVTSNNDDAHDKLVNSKLSTLLGASTGLRRLRLTPVSNVDKLLQGIHFANLDTFEIDISEIIIVHYTTEFANKVEEISKFLSKFITSHASTLRRLALSNLPQKKVSAPFSISCPNLEEILINSGHSISTEKICDLLDQLPSLRRVEIFIFDTMISLSIESLHLLPNSLRKLPNLTSLCIPISEIKLEAYLLDLSNAVPGLQELTVVQGFPTLPSFRVFAPYLAPFKSLKRVHIGHAYMTYGYTSDEATNDTVANAFAGVENLEEVVVTMKGVDRTRHYMKTIGIERLEGGGVRGVMKGLVGPLGCVRILARTNLNVGFM